MIKLHLGKGKQMDTNTEISTAARRIVRQLNEPGPEMVYYFDAEGGYITGHQVGLFYPSREAEERATAGAVVKFRTGRKLSQRIVQDELDAAAKFGEDLDARADYLEELNYARENVR